MLLLDRPLPAEGISRVTDLKASKCYESVMIFVKVLLCLAFPQVFYLYEIFQRRANLAFTATSVVKRINNYRNKLFHNV